MTIRTEAWVKRHLGASATLGQPLEGGITSVVRSVQTVSGSFVLKQVTNRDWLDERPDVVDYEARVIGFLGEMTAIPVPDVVAIDPDGDAAGDPSMILSMVDAPPAGSVGDPDEILAALARTAIQIGEVAAPEWLRPFSRYLEPDQASPPDWSRATDTWAAAIDAISQPSPTVRSGFIHRDFHQWNVLWSGRIAAVVDWSQTSIGPHAMDVAHCRMNLSVQWGSDVADRFRQIWESMTGERHDPYFDIITLIDLLPDWRPRARENQILDNYLIGLVSQL